MLFTKHQRMVFEQVPGTFWRKTGKIARTAGCTTQAAIRVLNRAKQLGLVDQRESSYEYNGKQRKTYEWRRVVDA